MKTDVKKIAIIGASIGQRELCIKAKEMGVYTICFAWDKGAICKELVDKFYPISILEKDLIVDICREEGVNGIVTNASDLPAEIAAYVSQQVGLNGNSYEIIKAIEDKELCRRMTAQTIGLSHVESYLYDEQVPHFLPCIIKPKLGGGKLGVSFARNTEEFNKGITYAKAITNCPLLIEQYIEGQEVSVECISFHGKHYIVQITDKVSSGAPHFVELAHHQPSLLPESIKQKITRAAIAVLDRLKFQNGATHTEMKISDTGGVFLIEVNPRGGGDHISNKLVELSTGYDYVKAMIEVALNDFEPSVITNSACSGIYFLCQQTANLLPLFENDSDDNWVIEKHYNHQPLVDSLGNYSRNGYLIYQSKHKITLNLKL